jgi:hypothetical protein
MAITCEGTRQLATVVLTNKHGDVIENNTITKKNHISNGPKKASVQEPKLSVNPSGVIKKMDMQYKGL